MGGGGEILRPGALSASCMISNGSLSLGGKVAGCGVDHPPPSSAEVKEGVELYRYSPSRPPWSVLR